MNMSNDDIRALLGISQESVRTHKYRLKKKLSLGKDQSLPYRGRLSFWGRKARKALRSSSVRNGFLMNPENP